MCSMVPIIKPEMNLFRANPPPHIVRHRVKSANVLQSSRPLPARTNPDRRKVKLPGSPPSGNHPTASRFRSVHNEVLQTIIEEDETHAAGVIGNNQVILSGKENVPVLDEADVCQGPAYSNLYHGPIPVPGHMTIWDRMVHRISSALHTGTMRNDLRRNSGEYVITNAPGHQAKEHGKVQKTAKHAASHAHRVLEAEVYPIPMREKQRFHFHGRI